MTRLPIENPLRKERVFFLGSHYHGRMIDREQLRTLTRIASDAGRAIMQVYASGGATWTKNDQSPLTEADLCSHEIILERLARSFPDVPVWSEEGARLDGGPLRSFFLVDPLDGTREFLKHNDEFTVNIGYIEDGEPVAGVVFAPALNELFFGSRELGAYKFAESGRERQIRTRPLSSTGPLRILGSRSHAGDELERWLRRLGRDYELVPAGSSLKFCRIAEGAADLYPRLSPTCQWDTAAGQAVLEAAGGCVIDMQGNALRYGVERPLINPHFIALARNDPSLRIAA